MTLSVACRLLSTQRNGRSCSSRNSAPLSFSSRNLSNPILLAIVESDPLWADDCAVHRSKLSTKAVADEIVRRLA